MPKVPSSRNPSKVATASVISIANRDKPEETTPMNFKVDKAFHREFKLYAVEQGMSMVELLQRSFHAFKDGQAG